MSDQHAPASGSLSNPHPSSAAAHPGVHADIHAGPGGHHDMHLKLYWGIGFALLFLTGFTVFLSYIDFGSIRRNIIIALLVASFKVSLVGAVFMHLKGEKPTIWRFLYFTAFFVLGLFMLTWFHWEDPIFGTSQNVH